MEKIDFVIAWVDGSDENWRKEKAQYIPGANTENADCRYRTLGTLKYSFRAFEKYTPWVNRIHFITWGHLPPWMNTDNPKLHIVNHKDYIPQEYLPTFSSHPIELNLHRIESLSEKFVYFNDDMIMNSPVGPEFFFKKGLPCDFLHVNNIYFDSSSDVYAHIQMNETWNTAIEFPYNRSFLKHPSKYINFKYPFKNNIKNLVKVINGKFYPGIENHHLASGYLKESFRDAWESDYELLSSVSSNKFRSPFDVSQSLIRYRQLVTGKFTPVSKKERGACFRVGDNTEKLCETILCGREKMICINDNPTGIDFEKEKAKIIGAYEKKLPGKSSFEI